MKPLTKDNYFCVLYRPGTQWIPSKTIREQPLAEHLAYMRALRDRGILKLGGPFKDDAGGMVVLEAETLQVAIELARRDPAVQTRVLTPEVHPWHPAAPGDVRSKPW